MKSELRLAVLGLLIIVSSQVFAQGVLTNKGSALDDIVLNENSPNRNYIPYPSLRQADVIWKHRIWRTIDLREKMNENLYYPTNKNANRKSFWDVIVEAVINKENPLTLYEPNTFDFDHSFLEPMSRTKADSALSRQTSVLDTTGASHAANQAWESQDMLQYMLKEDWFFEKQRSVMDVRILGICPFSKSFDGNGNETPGARNMMFWIYFPQLRPYIASEEVYNPHNDAERRTYEDIFWKRQFSSYIIQESNVANRAIASYRKDPLDALLEAESIKNTMFNLEHDMWQY